MVPFRHIARLTAALACAMAALAAGAEDGLRQETGALALAEPAAAGTDGRAVYIVQLRSPGAMAAGKRVLPRVQQKPSGRPSRPDRDAPEVAAAAQRAASEQVDALAKAGVDAQAIHSYRYAFNGFAARLTAAEAERLRRLSEVVGVQEDTIRPLATNTSPSFLGLFDREAGLTASRGLDGDGVVIAVIDSGIAPEHPSFADERAADSPRACQSQWGQNTLLGKWLCYRYKRRPAVQIFEPPENWAGLCQVGEEFVETDCNNKLIGARWYDAGARASGPIDAGEIFSARDVDGHGTHIAGTAAGNPVEAELNGSRVADIRGIAPKARIAVYKACWLRPGDTRASCNTSDLARAIDDAVADGVDIINYSIGNTEATVTGADDIALLNAAKAGVFPVVAAGNNGPALRTIGAPAGSPWVISVAASTRTGTRFTEASEVIAPPAIAGRYPTLEADFTPALRDEGDVEALVVIPDDDDTTDDGGGSNGSTDDACQAPVNTADLDGRIALIRRGACDFDVKVRNAQDAGAIAAVIINNAGAPILMLGDGTDITIPAVMIGQGGGTLIRDEIGAGSDVTMLLAAGLFLSESEDGNIMASFSSRGPSAGAPDVLKPDVTAPGVNILAPLSPDIANGIGGQQYGYLTGTSMATPHVAGIAALLKQENPDWSPATLRSALMTSARQDVVLGDGETPAAPFDFGAGHVDANRAIDPGLVYDAGADDYDAFACGLEEPPVDSARCEALAASAADTDPVQVNQASIAIENLTRNRVVRRRVTNLGEARTWQASVTLPTGFSADIQPASLSLGPGDSAGFELTLSFDGDARNLWYFGALEWTSDELTVRSPIALRPVSLEIPDAVGGAGGSGSLSFPVEFGYTGSYGATLNGLNAATVTAGFVDNDPTKTFTLRTGNGVAAFSLQVPENRLYVRFALFDQFTDGDDDLDLYVYRCPTDLTCSRVDESGTETSAEEVNIEFPRAGRYIAFVHGFETDEVAGGPGANFSLYSWQVGPLDSPGNATVTAPSLVAAGTTRDVTVDWRDLQTGLRYLGVISHTTPDGLFGLTAVEITN